MTSIGIGRFDKLTDPSGNPVIEPAEMTDYLLISVIGIMNAKAN